MSEDSVFESPVAESVQQVQTERIPPQPDPTQPSHDDQVLAGIGVRAVEWIADAISKEPKITPEEHTKGIETFAHAIHANWPDAKAGPLLLGLAAVGWTAGVLISRAKVRAAKRKKKVEETNGTVPPAEPSGDSDDSSGDGLFVGTDGYPDSGGTEE